MSESYNRECPKCGKLLIHTGPTAKYYSKYAQQKERLCNSCCQLKYDPITVFERECPICHEIVKYKGKKQFIRLSKTNAPCRSCTEIIKFHKPGSSTPSYNPAACKIFDEINKDLNWRGVHAQNGGEYKVPHTRYSVDYYEPTLNIVIEYDEQKHKYYPKEKELLREAKILDVLGCRLYRIQEGQNWREVLI